MGKGTLLGLVALVAVLGFVWLQREREIERGGPVLEDYPLCPGLEPERVRALRIDHLERGFQLRFERDAAGRWFMTDPLAYPAQGALVRALLSMLQQARGTPAAEVAPASVSLDPPLVVVECVQAGTDGAGEQRLRVELGALDVDPALVHARAPGHPAAEAAGTDVFRTTRTLTTTLERNPDDYRERRATTLRPDEVISLRRRGLVQREAGAALEDLAFDALATPDGWQRGTPPAVRLDPNAVALLVRGACELSAERFVDDSPSDLSVWGLAEPALVLELESVGQPSVVLELGHPPLEHPAPLADITWYAQRRGFAHVFEVKTRDVELLASPASLFFDQLVVRALRSDVVRLELEGGGARRVLERERERWSVREGDAEAGAAHPAETAAVEDALARLERVELAEHLPGEAFEPSDPPLSFTVALKDGTLQGGALGRPTRDPATGAQGLQFLRHGDEVVALIDPAIAELCRKPLDSFRARRVHQVQESLVRSIELEHAGTTFAFENDGDNAWSVRGQSIQAPQDFVQSLDGLLNLAAKRWLDSAPPMEVALTARIRPLREEPLEIVFGRAADGTFVCRAAGGVVAEVDGAVVQRLLKLF